MAAETGNYLSLFSATTSTITVILLGKLQWQYALLICSLSLIVTYPGLRMQAKILAKTGRPSIFSLLLLCFVTFCLFAVPSVSVYNLSQQKKANIDVMSVTPYC